MTISTRIAFGISAAALSLSLALAPAAFAQDAMKKDDGMMKKDTMSKESALGLFALSPGISSRQARSKGRACFVSGRSLPAVAG